MLALLVLLLLGSLNLISNCCSHLCKTVSNSDTPTLLIKKQIPCLFASLQNQIMCKVTPSSAECAEGVKGVAAGTRPSAIWPQRHQIADMHSLPR